MQSEYLSFGHKIIMPSPWDLSEWQQKVPAWIRNYYFFIPGVENVELLNGLYKLMLKGLSESYEYGYFASAVKSLQRLHSGHIGATTVEELYEYYLISQSLDFHLRAFTAHFSDGNRMHSHPARGLSCRANAPILNLRHRENMQKIQLTTQLDFWISQNREEDGGFGRPYEPFEKHDRIHTAPVPREEAIKLNLISEQDEFDITPAERERWCLPLVHPEDHSAPDRLEVVEQLKHWKVWHVRRQILANQTFKKRLKQKFRTVNSMEKELSTLEVRNLICKRAFGMTHAEYLASDIAPKSPWQGIARMSASQ